MPKIKKKKKRDLVTFAMLYNPFIFLLQCSLFLFIESKHHCPHLPLQTFAKFTSLKVLIGKDAVEGYPWRQIKFAYSNRTGLVLLKKNDALHSNILKCVYNRSSLVSILGYGMGKHGTVLTLSSNGVGRSIPHKFGYKAVLNN